VLRSHRITLVPLVFYVTSLWGIGLGGGYYVTTSSWAPEILRGASGYWALCTVGLVAAGITLCGYLAWVHRREA
jgi:MATE family multidrug resistance protein